MPLGDRLPRNNRPADRTKLHESFVLGRRPPTLNDRQAQPRTLRRTQTEGWRCQP